MILGSRIPGTLPPAGQGRFLRLMLASLLIVAGAAAVGHASYNGAQAEGYDLAPLMFTANQGQWNDTALYRSLNGPATIWYTRNGVCYQLFRAKTGTSTTLESDPVHQKPPALEQIAITTVFDGANPNAMVKGEEMSDYKCNYFHGSDSTHWRTDVPNYGAIRYSNLYDGIDLRFHGNGNELEFDFELAPGADPNQISMHFEGAKSVSLSANGELVVETPWNTITQSAPRIYQRRNGSEVDVQGAFVLRGPDSFGFRLTGSFDRSKPLVIDPILKFSTYLGGSDYEEVRDVKQDGTGGMLVCGYTRSSDFPLLNPVDNGFVDWEAFVTKLGSSGSSLVFSTFLGGSNWDFANAMNLYTGTIFLVGYTVSTNFPTVAPIDGSANGGEDAFVAELNWAGNSLAFSTYLGGSNHDEAWALAVRCQFPCGIHDTFVWVTGMTYSTDFPTVNAMSTTLSGPQDAFATELDLGTFTSSIPYSTYLGGNDRDQGSAILVDASFKPIISGWTASTNFPVANAYKGFLTGIYDAFITKLGVAGNGHLYPTYSTYFGGAEETGEFETFGSLLFRGNGDVLAAGSMGSPGLATANAYDQSYGYGGGDAFLAEFDPNLTTLVYGSYLGGSGWDGSGGPSSLATDGEGNLYLTGWTYSLNFPMLHAYDSTLNNFSTSYKDAFVSKLNSSGSSLQFSTYLGGSNEDLGEGIAVDGLECMYVGGSTSSSDLPVLNPYGGSLSGTADAFLVKLCVPPASCGDPNGDASTDISDAVYLIAYIFSGGPAPNPLLSGDANCDQSVDISDTVYLISYIFSGGPAPCAACQ